MKIRGLLLKDIFELWAQCRVQLVLTGVYLLLPLFIKGIGLFASVGMMLLAMMPIYALGYDERCRWERYALAMPVRKSDLFWSRFLLGVIAIALGAAVQTLAALLAGAMPTASRRLARASLPSRRYGTVGRRLSSHHASADDEARRGKGSVSSSAADHGVHAAVRSSCVRQTGASVVEFSAPLVYDIVKKFILPRRSP